MTSMMDRTAATQPTAAAYDVTVIGGGASGLAAALSAASHGASVLLVERDVEPGLPILVTGNGRCNISNARLDARRYRHPDIFEAVAGAHPEADIERFFSSLGLVMAQEGGGRLYPVTRRADSVRDVLLSGLSRAGVHTRCCCELVSPQYDESQRAWTLTLCEPAHPLAAKASSDHKTRIRALRRAHAAATMRESRITSRSVIIATGGGSSHIASLFNISHTQEAPALCPLACISPLDGLALNELDGLRVHASLALMRKGACIAFESGEVLFRPYGISGIAAFNLSRVAHQGDRIELDLFPHLSAQDLQRLLRDRAGAIGPYTGSASWFDGLLARPLSCALVPLINREHDTLIGTSRLLHALPLSVQGPAEPKQAQVTSGGIPFTSCEIPSLRITDGQHPRLFACGEALDMDADCGGYNLAWAWLSGMRAGTGAAR